MATPKHRNEPLLDGILYSYHRGIVDIVLLFFLLLYFNFNNYTELRFLFKKCFLSLKFFKAFYIYLILIKNSLNKESFNLPQNS